MNPMHRSLLPSVIGGLLLAVSGAALGQEPLFDLEASLVRVGAQLERRYQRSQRIVSTEMVWVRSFTHDMRSNGSPRRLEFERRVEWDTSEEDGVPTVTVFRELRSVNGQEPQQRDRDACLTPRSEAEDPFVGVAAGAAGRVRVLPGRARVDRRPASGTAGLRALGGGPCRGNLGR